MPIYVNAKEKFFNSVTILANDCWQWLGALNNVGYGTFYWEGELLGVHRFIRGVMVGELSSNLVIDHLCRNTWCVNPFHLDEVTQEENVGRGDPHGAFQANQTHCIHGHEFNIINTGIYRGNRYCRTCKRIRTRLWRNQDPGE
jgi:hypothetical protein